MRSENPLARFLLWSGMCDIAVADEGGTMSRIISQFSLRVSGVGLDSIALTHCSYANNAGWKGYITKYMRLDTEEAKRGVTLAL